MAWYKKVFSGIAKVFRKIGRGIKKVAKKIGGFIGKFGIVGQLGMFMLMPHIGSWIWKGMLKMAPGVLGAGATAASAATAGTASAAATAAAAGSTGATAAAGLTAASTATVANVGQLASALSTGNIVQRAAGLIMKGAHLTGKAYSGVTTMIDQGVNWVKDTGSKIFGRGNEAKMLTDDAISAGKTLMESGKEGIFPPTTKPFPDLTKQATKDTFSSYGYTPPIRHTVPSGPFLTPAQSAELAKLEPSFTAATGPAEKTLGQKAGEKGLEFTKAAVAAAFEEGVNPPVRDDDDYGTSMWVGPMHTPELTQANQNDFMLAQRGHPYGNNSYVQHMNQIFGGYQDAYFSWLNGIPMIPSARGNQYSTA